jgi:hypothetical protein
MSLKALARERLAIICSGETAGETCFKPLHPTPALVKHAKLQNSAENDACFTVSPSRDRDDETRVNAG